VVFVFAVGLLFAWLVASTRCLVGVTVAHGLTNTLQYAVLPLLAVTGPVRSTPPALVATPVAVAGARTASPDDAYLVIAPEVPLVSVAATASR
jgi:hypothetical protein